MKTAIRSPKIAIEASPRSLMIFRSCPAVIWLIRYEAAIRMTEKPTRL